MKMLPKEYDKAVGEPFRVEDYRGAKLEMYYLDDRADYSKFASRGRFSVWTSNGTDYRLFVDKGYYTAVSDLYQNEINTIWLDFTNSIYAEQKRLSNKYMLISFIMLFVLLGISLAAQTWFSDAQDTVFLVSIVALFVGLFGSSSLQQKKLRALVDVENKKATDLIRAEIGEDAFQQILSNQEAYYQQYFQPAADETDAEAVDVDQLDQEEKEEIQTELENKDGENNE